MPKKRYYYSNLLINQNQTAKTNIVWAADFTTLKIPEDEINKEINIFLCIDIHTNTVVTYSVSLRKIVSRVVVQRLSRAIDKRFVIPPKKRLIIHTDRGTQFYSKTYYEFTQNYKDYFDPSMSREATPTDNSVMERFVRTFKNHKLDGLTISQSLAKTLEHGTNINQIKPLINSYINSLQQRPNKKSRGKPPAQHDKDISVASMLMIEPKYTKAFSKYFGLDLRLEEIDKFKQQNEEVLHSLNEIAAQTAELVDGTPFDTFDDNLALKNISKRITELYALIISNPEITREYVEDAIQPVQLSIDELHNKIDTLIPKKKVRRNVEKLRDPLDNTIFPLIFANAGSNAKRQIDLKQARLRVLYTILNHTGMRLNEVRTFTYEDIRNATLSSQFSVIHYKTGEPHIHVITPEAVQELKKLEQELTIIFDKYQCKYLFGKDKPMHHKALTRIVNKDLKRTCELSDVGLNIKSHSFRVNVISGLLKVTSVQKVADIIGHKDIRSTLRYSRYSLSKREIQDLLSKINQNKPN